MEALLLKTIAALFNGFDVFCKGYFGHIFIAVCAGNVIIWKFTTKIAVKHKEYDGKIERLESDVKENKSDFRAIHKDVAEIKTDVNTIKIQLKNKFIKEDHAERQEASQEAN